jgi:hypothetical protein
MDKGSSLTLRSRDASCGTRMKIRKLFGDSCTGDEAEGRIVFVGLRHFKDGAGRKHVRDFPAAVTIDDSKRSARRRSPSLSAVL